MFDDFMLEQKNMIWAGEKCPNCGAKLALKSMGGTCGAVPVHFYEEEWDCPTCKRLYLIHVEEVQPGKGAKGDHKTYGKRSAK